MSEPVGSAPVLHLFHWTTAGVTFAAVFALFVLMPAAPAASALVALAGMATGLWRTFVPGRVRLPFQRVGLPAGHLDGLLAAGAFGGPLTASAMVLLG